MKKIIILSGFLVSLMLGANAEILNQKVLKAFKETFPEAQNVNWQENGKTFNASFSLQQISVLAMYDDNGNLLKTRRVYSPQFLSPNVLMKVKKRFGSKEINVITEISTGEEVIYEITLKDEKYWYKIISDTYGNLTLQEKFRRGEPGVNK